MININLQLDPLIYEALNELAALQTRGLQTQRVNRAQVIRDALYTALWNAQRNGVKLRRALDCPKNYNDQPYRLKSGRVVRVDSWGLED